MADAKLTGLDKLLARLSHIPEAAKTALKAQLKTEADDLVQAIQRAMDVAYAGHGDDGTERLRDSVHAYENPDRAISYRVIADAKDAEGKFIGSNVEAGHRAVDGTHVAARPAFFPTYRARKGGMKKRLSKAAKDAVKREFGG